MLFFSSALIIAQEGRHHHKGPGEKMKDLEKAKLIEALDMDEETTLKFFSRRNAHMEKMEGFRKQEDDQIEKINELAESTDNPNDPQLKKMIDDYLKIRNDMDEERRTFINSLNDILTYKQIARLVAFEPRFRDEIRKIILEKRGHEPPR
jgi:hypothetical protein